MRKPCLRGLKTQNATLVNQSCTVKVLLVLKHSLAQAQEGSLHHRIVCVKSVNLFSTHSSVVAVRSSGVFDTSVAARAGEHEGRV